MIAPSKEKVDPRKFPNQPYVGLEHVEAHTMRVLSHGRGGDVESTKSTFMKGDVLYGKLRPYLNKVAQPDFDGICSTDFLVFRESKHLERDYLAQYLNQVWIVEAATQASRGVQLPRINWEFLANLPVSFPADKSAQHVIAGVLRKIRGRQSDAQQHLVAARRAVDEFRKSVLVAACSGRLRS
ncbi:MAG: restriction endonuclease subunit S, partial [Candidatus Dormibacteraeota bacterium]|nr:restriction endonuclease subunit S [Candidatus Dormibacteraeota bacterium]